MIAFFKRLPISIDYLIFITARVIGIIAKPALLAIFLKLELKTEADHLSQLYLVLSGVLVFFSVPVHFDFYKLYFDQRKHLLRLRKTIETYLSLLIIHSALVSPLIIAIIWVTTKQMWFSLLILAFLYTEKLFDEIQRFLQFSKQFTAWSIFFLSKHLLPFIVVVLYTQTQLPKPTYVYIIMCVIVTLIASQFYLPKLFRSGLRQGLAAIDRAQIKSYFAVLKESYGPKYLQGISTANIQNIDKWAASKLFPSLFLSELMLVSQFSNGITVGTNNLVMAHRRKDLLQSKNSVHSLLMGWKVPALIACLSLAVFVFFVGFNAMIRDFKYLSVTMIGFIIASYAIYSMTEPLKEYLFWNGKMRITLSIDAVYFAIVLSGGAVLAYYGAFIYMPVCLFFGSIYRIVAELIYVRHVSKTLNLSSTRASLSTQSVG